MYTCTQNGSKAAQVPQLELHIQDLTAKLKALELQLQSIQPSQGTGEDATRLVQGLELRLRQEQEIAHVLRSQVTRVPYVIRKHVP
jgi:hypothetical protein